MLHLDRKPHKKKTQIMTSLIKSVIILAVFEIIARMCGFPEPGASAFGLPTEFPRETCFAENSWFIRDPLLAWKLSEDYLDHGHKPLSGGFRSAHIKGELIDYAPPESILCMGDSVTYGIELPPDETWPAHLSSLIDRPVINAGVPGYSSWQGFQWLKTIITDLKPEIIVIQYGWNDHWPVPKGAEDSHRQTPSPSALAIHKTLSDFGIYHALRHLLASSHKIIKDSRRVPINDYENNIVDIGNLISEQGAIPVFLSSPTIRNSETEKSSKEHIDYEEILFKTAKFNDWPIVSINNSLNKEYSYYLYPDLETIHLNSKGCELLAEDVYKSMKDLLHSQER